jgi:methyl-accepting chemotaxis protein
MQEGVATAALMGDAMAAIDVEASDVAASIVQMSEAMHEQLSAQESLARNMESISSRSQTNGHEVEAIAQSANSLKDIASSLQASVRRIRL